jgi:23S rRNA A1618 N6-methylase RlmF
VRTASTTPLDDKRAELPPCGPPDTDFSFVFEIESEARELANEVGSSVIRTASEMTGQIRWLVPIGSNVDMSIVKSRTAATSVRNFEDLTMELISKVHITDELKPLVDQLKDNHAKRQAEGYRLLAAGGADKYGR